MIINCETNPVQLLWPDYLDIQHLLSLEEYHNHRQRNS